MPDLSQSALLIVDIQSGSFTPSAQRGFDGLDTRNQTAYLHQLSETAEKFRQEGRPVVWVTIREGSAFIGPHELSSDVKDPKQLQEIGWFDGTPVRDEKTRLSIDNFHAFSETNGPQLRDAAVKKMGYNTFNPNERGTSELLQYLESKDTKNLVLIGCNADVCITATALGAALNGYGVTVLSDLVLSDHNPHRSVPPQQYESEMKARLDKVGTTASSINRHLSRKKLLEEGIDLADARTALAAQTIQTKTSTAFFESQSPDPMKGYRGSSHGRSAGHRQKAPVPVAGQTRPPHRFHHRPVAHMRPI